MRATKIFSAQIALAVARRVVTELKPACERIEIAGSLRRRNHTVHDIDIVLVPRNAPEKFSLGGLTVLDGVISQLVSRGSLTPVRGKEKIKVFVASKTGIPMDIYIAGPETWATLLLIRTGSKEHNIKLAQRARELGMKLRASGDGIENGNGDLLRVDAEEDIFRLLELPYLRPEERT
jgi:DNA polymerase/3'-5' exonuclease PolX